jgi:Tol biopolymer transport system component
MKNGNIKMRKIIMFLTTVVFSLLSSCRYMENNYEIIFSNNYTDIFQIKDDGKSNVEQLTFTPEIGEYYLQVSDNGEQIVFHAISIAGQTDSEESPEINDHIYLLNTNDKKLDDITNNFRGSDYPWSEYTINWAYDLNKFGVIRFDKQEDEYINYLDVIEFNGSDKQRYLIPTIGNMSALVNGAIWSPDREMLILSQEVIEQPEKYPGSLLFIYFLNDGRTVQLTNYEDNCYLSSWSPTSKQIVAMCRYISSNGILNNPGEKTIRIFNAENVEQLYDYVGFSPCEYPSWSPDGEQISFVCKKKNGEEGIFVVNADGSEFHEIDIKNFDDFWFFHGPHWSPDGTKIIYVAFLSNYDASHGKIYSVNIDGSDNHAITNEEGQYIIEAVYPIN